MNRAFAFFATLGTLLLPAAALAHPGHGSSEPTGLLHYLLEPVHVLALVAAVLVGAVTVRLLRSARRQRSED